MNLRCCPESIRNFVSKEDTEAAVSDLQIPQVHSEVIGGYEGLEVRVHGDGVDVVGVGVAEHSPGCGFDHQIHRLQHRHLERGSEKKQQTETKRFEGLHVPNITDMIIHLLWLC